MKWNPDDEGPFIEKVMSRTGVTVNWAAGKRRSFIETSWTCHELLMSPCDLVWEIGNPKRPSHSLSLSHPPTFSHGTYHTGRYSNEGLRKDSRGRHFPGGPVIKTLPSNAGGAGSAPGQGAKIQHVSQPKSQNIRQKEYCNKVNKDFKNGTHQKNL